MGRAVSEGTVDTAFDVQPFTPAAMAQYDNLVNLGDPADLVLPAESPTTVIVTSADTADEKADVMKEFRAALEEAIDRANADPEAYKLAGATLIGMDPEVAKSLVSGKFRADVTGEQIQPLVDLMVEFEWVEETFDTTAFVGG